MRARDLFITLIRLVGVLFLLLSIAGAVQFVAWTVAFTRHSDDYWSQVAIMILLPAILGAFFVRQAPWLAQRFTWPEPEPEPQAEAALVPKDAIPLLVWAAGLASLLLAVRPGVGLLRAIVSVVHGAPWMRLFEDGLATAVFVGITLWAWRSIRRASLDASA